VLPFLLGWPFAVPEPFNQETLTRWIPGIVFRYPARDAIRPGNPKELSWRAWKQEERLRARQQYLAVYTAYFEQDCPLPGKTLQELVQTVCTAFTITVDDAVDYWGNSLVRTH